jgi:SAM-dependent methyltransferase
MQVRAGMGRDARTITYITPPTSVSMTDWWYEIAHLNHFWIRRRFEVMRRLADPIIRQALCIAEVGCGNGLVQRQIEDYYGVLVAGFELNELALNQNCSRTSPLYCYDIRQRSKDFQSKFDLLLLFDVLEHIDQENMFLEALKHHMTASGRLLVNVPAHQFLYSGYDRVAGHVRRYSINYLEKVAAEAGFCVSSFTYWGFPMIPLLLLRKALVSLRRDEHTVISCGFDPGPSALNSALMFLARCEMLPQKFIGTSLMAVLEYRRPSASNRLDQSLDEGFRGLGPERAGSHRPLFLIPIHKTLASVT